MSSTIATDPPPTEQPIYWFVRLEQAITAGDFEAALRAQRELKRLGVTVRYGRPRRPPTTKGGGHVA